MSPNQKQDLWPKWMWIAAPVLVVVVTVGLWWAIIPRDSDGADVDPTATAQALADQPTQAPTLVSTLSALPTTTADVPVLPTVGSPSAEAAATPSAAPTVDAGIVIGDDVEVSGTSGVLNMRDGAGTSYSVVGTLSEGAIVEVVGGPQTADGYTWFQVRTDDGTVGWAADDWLEEVK